MTLDQLVRSTISFKKTRANPPRISVSRFDITAFDYEQAEGGLLARTWKKIKKAVSDRVSRLLKRGKDQDKIKNDEKETFTAMVMIKSVAKSEVGAGNYNTFLLAKDISVSREKDKDHRTELADGAYMGSLSYHRTEVKVRCDCPDFRWRFAWYNDLKKALYGLRPPPYRRKTNRPPVNPKQLPGMCKHLMNVVKILSSRHVVK